MHEKCNIQYMIYARVIWSPPYTFSINVALQSISNWVDLIHMYQCVKATSLPKNILWQTLSNAFTKALEKCQNHRGCH